jgi:signal transduction histidine kinase
LGGSTRQARHDIGSLLRRFNFAFSLMSIIPLLTCVYLITVRLFSFSVLQGMNGVYLLLALAIALLGLLAGHQLIRDIIRQLVGANEQLARLNERQAAFVSNVSHEFRAPLAVFKGALDNLADGLHGPLTQEQVEPVAMCRKEINRLIRLVGDLLDVSRLEAGKLRLSQEEVQVQELLQSVAAFFGGLLKERGLSLALELPRDPVTIIGDRDRLRQVFLNLLTNAIKFTERGGIRIRLTADGDAVRIDVEDTGAGIAPADRERIFDKFERVGSQAEEGAGLGLPIARDLVELHRGRVWVESEPGRGSRFIVRLPRRPQEAAA